MNSRDEDMSKFYETRVCLLHPELLKGGDREQSLALSRLLYRRARPRWEHARVVVSTWTAP